MCIRILLRFPLIALIFGLGYSDTGHTKSSSSVIHDLGVQYIDGVRYRKFEQHGLTILVPNLWNLSSEDFEKAFCAKGISGPLEKNRPMVRAAQSIGNDVKAFAEIIQKTIQVKCEGDGSQPAVSIRPNFDLGISIPLGKDAETTGKNVKVFNRNLGTNLNLGLDF